MGVTVFEQEDFIKKDVKKAELYRSQIFSVFAISYLCISAGNFLGYTSSALPSLKEDSDHFTEISPHDISWIGGLGPLGAMAGSLFTLIPLPKLGARKTIFACGAPSLIMSWLIIGFANSVCMIFVGRFLGGAGTGIVIVCSPLYVLEVVSIEVRGRLGILPQFLMIFGILISYILGSFLNWSNLSFACAVLALPSLVLLSFAPDSPVWLVSQRQNGDKALKVLEKLHGSQAPTLLLGLQANATMKLLQSRKIGERQNKFDFNPGMMKASAVALGILSFQQLTGINGLTFYAVSIFREASTSMNPHVPSIILASTQLLASYISTCFVERFGRKILLIVSSILIGISGSVLGSYFYFCAGLPHLSWVPLTALILFAFGFAIGYGPVAWILVAELLPVETRHIINPLAIAYNWFCVFLVTKSFPLLLLEIKIYGIFWLYSAIALVGLVFVVLCVPETKGRTSEEIANFFGESTISTSADCESNESENQTFNGIKASPECDRSSIC